MGRMASHLLNQKNFYPLYPPNKEMCIDHDLFKDFGVMSCKPHILILPSTLRHFVKVRKFDCHLFSKITYSLSFVLTALRCKRCACICLKYDKRVVSSANFISGNRVQAKADVKSQLLWFVVHDKQYLWQFVSGYWVWFQPDGVTAHTTADCSCCL